MVRNHCKRRLRVLFRELSTKLPDGWYVFVAKKVLYENRFDEARRDCNYVLKKAIMGASGD